MASKSRIYAALSLRCSAAVHGCVLVSTSSSGGGVRLTRFPDGRKCCHATCGPGDRRTGEYLLDTLQCTTVGQAPLVGQATWC